MTYLRTAILGVSLTALISSSTLAATPEELAKTVKRIELKGERDIITVNGIKLEKYELVFDGTKVNGDTYDFLRLSYIPHLNSGSLVLSLFKKLGPAQYEGLIIYDGNGYGKMDGSADKILHQKFSWMEMLQMWYTDGECLKRYTPKNPDEQSRMIYDYFLKRK